MYICIYVYIQYDRWNAATRTRVSSLDDTNIGNSCHNLRGVGKYL